MTNNIIDYLGYKAEIHFDSTKMLFTGVILETNPAEHFVAHDIISLKAAYEKTVELKVNQIVIKTWLQVQGDNLAEIIASGERNIEFDPKWDNTQLGIFLSEVAKVADGASFTLREKWSTSYGGAREEV